jgi:heavy metal translocating P-type ATPase
VITRQRVRRLLLGFVLAALLAGLLAGAWPAPLHARLAFDAAALPVLIALSVDLLAALRRGSFGVDVIALLAILGALALGEHLVAAIVAVMFAGGTALEEFAEARAHRELQALLTRSPRVAHRYEHDALADVSVEAVRVGDRLLVKPGEIVPVDGVLVGTSAILGQSALTGEPLPVACADGGAVASGVLNAGPAFAMRATAPADASTFAAVVRLVSAAEKDRPRMVRLADRGAMGLLAATLLLGGLAWALAGTAERALAVLVVATPCPLILAAPVAFICGVSRLARRGVIVKGGGALERLARASTGLFDKTGTLTVGRPRVAGVEALDDFDADLVLRLAASLEQASPHGVAAAIVAAAEARGLPLEPPEAVAEVPGGGLAGGVGRRRVMVGSAGLLADAGLAPPRDGPAARMARAAATASWVALDGSVAGAILLSDPIRPDAPRAVRELRAAGLRRLVMVSGDRTAAAEEIGRALALDAVHAELSPAGKIAVVKAERAAGPTLMIGDGINDAPALAAADVGVALGASGAAAAAEAADAVVMVDRLDRVAEAVRIARRARFIALQSIAIGIGLSGAAMLAAAFGYLPPVAGALLQEGIDVLVILNALRALGGDGRDRVRPLKDRAAVQRLVEEHARLRALMERMRDTAARLNRRAAPAPADLREIAEAMNALLLPHQRAEEARLYPALAGRLGGRDPLGAMNRMHDEIARESRRFAALLDALGDSTPTDRELRELQRLLQVLEALIDLHLTAEEELLGHIEDLPVAPLDLRQGPAAAAAVKLPALRGFEGRALHAGRSDPAGHGDGRT